MNSMINSTTSDRYLGNWQKIKQGSKLCTDVFHYSELNYSHKIGINLWKSKQLLKLFYKNLRKFTQDLHCVIRLDFGATRE